MKKAAQAAFFFYIPIEADEWNGREMISDNLVEIASYSFPHEAHVARASLDAAGIPAFLTDEHTINMQWMYSNALGGVRLLVHRENADAALEILSTDFSDSLANDEWVEPMGGKPGIKTRPETCSRCGSENLTPHVAGRVPAFVVWMLLGIPLFFFRRGMKCETCGKFTKS